MKHTIRQQMKEIIKSIPQDKKEEYSLCITQKIIEKFGHLKTRHIYIAMADEVNTTPLITHLQQAGKTIFSCDTPEIELTPIDIAIVPGRAFTHDNKRVGRGKGHYDRFLAQHPQTKKIGICFPEQILPRLPTQDHDIPMDEIITA